MNTTNNTGYLYAYLIDYQWVHTRERTFLKNVQKTVLFVGIISCKNKGLHFLPTFQNPRPTIDAGLSAGPFGLSNHCFRNFSLLKSWILRVLCTRLPFLTIFGRIVVTFLLTIGITIWLTVIFTICAVFRRL